MRQCSHLKRTSARVIIQHVTTIRNGCARAGDAEPHSAAPNTRCLLYYQRFPFVYLTPEVEHRQRGAPQIVFRQTLCARASGSSWSPRRVARA